MTIIISKKVIGISTKNLTKKCINSAGEFSKKFKFCFPIDKFSANLSVLCVMDVGTRQRGAYRLSYFY